VSFIYSSDVPSSTSSRAPHEQRSLITRLIDHALTFNRYTSVFEIGYKNSTRAFYKAEAAKLVEECKDDTAKYVDQCNTRLAQEGERMQAVVPRETWYEIGQATRHAFLSGREAWIAKDGARPAPRLSRSDWSVR
jgi:hypothetical protein